MVVGLILVKDKLLWLIAEWVQRTELEVRGKNSGPSPRQVGLSRARGKRPHETMCATSSC